MTKTKLEQYRARQAERIEAISRAIDEGETTVVPSVARGEKKSRIRFLTLTPHGSKPRFWAVRGWPQATI